jgi:polysaccharide biosynthesis protein PslH
MNILIITPSMPFPPDTGGPIRTLELVKRIGGRHTVDLATIGLPGATDPGPLRDYCRRVHVAAWSRRPKPLQLPSLLLKIARGIPLETKYAESDDLTAILRRIAHEECYDVIHMEKSATAVNLGSLRLAPHTATVFGLQDVGHVRHGRMARTETRLRRRLWHWQNRAALAKWEPHMARRCDTTLVVSETDRDLLRALDASLDIAVVPNGIAVGTCPMAPREGRRREILIIGTLDYEPNRDAVLYFIRSIYPAVRSELPDVALSIVGRNPPAEIAKLDNGRDVRVFANVPDPAPFYLRAGVAAVPLRAGSGTRLKILEAMAYGTPVVSSPIGCEGIAATDGRDIVIADSAEAFARETARLLAFPPRWQELATQARRLVETHYDWDPISRRLEDAYAHACERRRAGRAAHKS